MNGQIGRLVFAARHAWDIRISWVPSIKASRPGMYLFTAALNQMANLPSGLIASIPPRTAITQTRALARLPPPRRDPHGRGLDWQCVR